MVTLVISLEIQVKSFRYIFKPSGTRRLVSTLIYFSHYIKNSQVDTNRLVPVGSEILQVDSTDILRGITRVTIPVLLVLLYD